MSVPLAAADPIGMVSTIIGLDVGTNAVRAAEVSLGATPVLRGFGQVALPPGAVHEGEVVDVGAVAQAIKKLWVATGFRSRSARVGLASPRVIVRVVELPDLPAAEARSALGLQLDEYVPLAPEDTVFDFEPIRSDGGESGRQRVVLAATHRDAICPLIDAVREAGVKVEAVDVVPAALARALGRSRPQQDDAVEMIVSVGAGTAVVVAARDGAPIFARTITTVAGGHMTRRIAAELSVSDVEAERLKRREADETSAAVAVRAAVQPAIDELVDEIADSVDYYLAQEDAAPIARVLVTGGGSLQTHLVGAIALRLHAEVLVADPFTNLEVGDIGYDDADLPFLAPYLPAAVGLALAAGGREKHLDLTPDSVRVPRANRRALVAAGGALVLVAAGWFYVQQRGAVTEERAATATAEGALAAVRAELETVGTGTSSAAGAASVAHRVIEASIAVDLDWLAIAQELDGINAATAVTLDGIGGTVDAAAATAGDTAGRADDDAGDGAAPPGGPTGTLHVSGTAADPTVVAGWVEAVLMSPRVADAWVDNIGAIPAEDGSSSVEFTAQLTLSPISGVGRPIRGGASA